MRLRLRKIDPVGPAANHHKLPAAKVDVMEEDHGLYDSGRESPTTGSAIVRRRRHRASKSTAAWLTQAQTVHPKSSKSTIEKLMSLILEQGETIQHQLSKLRDREIEISQLEEQKHKIREQEHGKNYLLETYLKGLHEAEDREQTTLNSDSGVNTEDICAPEEVDEDEGKKVIIPSRRTKKSHIEYTERENELLRDHDKLKLSPETVTKGLEHKSKSQPVTTDGVNERGSLELEDEIDVLEKIYAINKTLQKEEELLVRLNAKLKRYESENPHLKEDEILDTLNRLNSEIEQRSRDIEITNREIELSNELLKKKSFFLNELTGELGETLDEEATLMVSGIESDKGQSLANEEANDFDLNPENIYSISKILLKYSDDGGCGAPETDRYWNTDQVNLVACHRPAINKTDTNKRIIIDTTRPEEEMRPFSASPHQQRITTRVQIHMQPQNPRIDIDNTSSLPSGNHYLRQMNFPNMMCPTSSTASADRHVTTPPTTTGIDATLVNVTNLTPVDLIALQKDQDQDQDLPPQPASSTRHQVPGITNKVGLIISASNISATLKDNESLANKNLGHAYEGLSLGAMAAAPPPAALVDFHQQQYPCGPQADMTQLGTLV